MTAVLAANASAWLITGDGIKVDVFPAQTHKFWLNADFD